MSYWTSGSILPFDLPGSFWVLREFIFAQHAKHMLCTKSNPVRPFGRPVGMITFMEKNEVFLYKLYLSSKLYSEAFDIFHNTNFFVSTIAMSFLFNKMTCLLFMHQRDRNCDTSLPRISCVPLLPTLSFWNSNCTSLHLCPIFLLSFGDACYKKKIASVVRFYDAFNWVGRKGLLIPMNNNFIWIHFNILHAL